MSSRDVPWAVLNYVVQPPQLQCQRCGASEKLPLPLRLEVAAFTMKSFAKIHAHCKEKEAKK